MSQLTVPASLSLLVPPVISFGSPPLRNGRLHGRAAAALTVLGLGLGFLAGPTLGWAKPAVVKDGPQLGAAQVQVPKAAPAPSATASPLLHPDERHLGQLRQLTAGGENAEAYWSFDGQSLSLQATTANDRCDQIYTLNLREPATGLGTLSPVSGGHGRHTCSYYFPTGDRLLFSSTRHIGEACPPTPDRSKGYVWPLYNYQIYSSKPDGSDLKRLTQTQAYDAEATVCRDGSVIFTSDRDGDLELYRMNLDGTGVKRLTNAPGYDGGAFFSEDCKHIVWRAARPRTMEELTEMRALLKEHLVRPTRMELWVANADGSGAHPVTDFGAASFAPYFYPAKLAGGANRRIIFSSNYGDPRGREFDIWAVNSDGTKLERITFSPDFDGFPIFSPDGSRLAFASNRGGKAHGETNIFVANWQAGPAVPTAFKPTSADEIQKRVAWLSDPAREGRGVGTKGLAAAADQLAKWMAETGLAAGGDPAPAAKAGQPSFFQDVEVFVGVRDQGSSVRVEEPAPARPLRADQAIPAGMSGSGAFAGRLRFCGYGITAPEAHWDDFAGSDVKGMVAVILRGVPANKFSGGAARSYSDLRFKAWSAREHGAVAVAFVDLSSDGVPKLTLDGPEGGAGLPVVYLAKSALADLLRGGAAVGADVLASIEKAAAEGKPSSIEIPGRLAGDIKLARESRRERNVIGVLSSGVADAPVMVLGAHYDHLGLGGRGSLAPGEKVVHPGADDNASGTAALLHAAARLKAQPPATPMDVYFVAFTAEEVGLVGSGRFIEKLPAGLRKDRIKAMFNFDMVGRLGSTAGQTLPSVVVQGSDSAADWAGLVAPRCQALGLFCRLGGDGYGPSDMTPFYGNGVPVLFFFTGAHGDYHRPTDTAEKLNAMGIGQIADLAAHLTRDTADRLKQNPTGLAWKKPSGPPPRAGDRGYGAYLGTIPDYTAMQGSRGGVKLTGARPQSPAEAAGVRAGDVLVGLGDSKIETLEDMAFALKKYKPGQQVDVVVLRDGQRVVLKTTLKARTE
jgi:Tol biopolymer transport system component